MVPKWVTYTPSSLNNLSKLNLFDLSLKTNSLSSIPPTSDSKHDLPDSQPVL